LFPLQFRLQSVSQQNDDRARPAPAVNQSSHTYKVLAETTRNALEGVSSKKISRVKNTALQFNDWAAGVVDRDQLSGRDGVTPGTAFTSAILYDAYGGGSNFSQEVFSMELKVSEANELVRGVDNAAGVIGATSNKIDGTSATAVATNLYFLNQNTILYSPQGIQLER
jgi:hypothetical protein